jgi:DNA-binding CsgD family transcriptional regulator
VALPFLDSMRSAPCAGDVRLQPLSDGAVESIVAAALGAAAPGFSAACAEATGGNPFLLDELLRELRERQVEPTEDEAATVLEVVPDSVRHAAGLRLARLSPIARAVAQAAAVLADTGTLHECAAVAGLKEELAAEGADELVLAEVIAPGEPLRHVHPLLRAAVASTVPPHALGAAHARAATVLRGEGAPIERVAVHLLAAPVGQGSSAAEALSAAARRALAQGAPDVAVRLLRRAIREPLTPPERAELHFELGSALAVTADGAAPAEIATAIELTALPSRRAEMFLRLGATYAAQGRHHDAASAFDRGLAILPEGHDALRRDLDASFVAAASMVAALRERSIQRMEAMLAAHSDGDARPLERGVLANQALQRAMLASPREEVVPLALRAWGDGALLAEETCDGKSWNLVTGTLSLCGELAASERVCDAVLADARERGSMLGFGTASYCRSFPRLRAGRISDAMADVAGAYEARQQGWEMFAGALTAVHAEVLIEQGEVDAAGEVLAVADDARWVGTIERPMLLHSRARLHHAAGRLEDALADWLTVGELLGESGLDVPGLLPWRPSAAVVLAQLGRCDAAADLAREAEAIARRCDVTQAIGRALRARALVEGGPEGIALFEEAVAVLERSEAGLELIEALVGYGAALRRAGRRMDARAPLARAAQLAHEGGAAALGLRAQEELRASGARPRRVQVVGAEALTPQERRVAVMAAEGRNNREIAQTLFVTPKAVEWHLGNTYRKLDIRSRKELPAALGAERGAA